jgi:hypothetical protein
MTATYTATATETKTPTVTPTATLTPTPTATLTSTPTSPPGCQSILNYAYPNPDPGKSLQFLYVLCENSWVQIQVLNGGGVPVAKWETSGGPGNNLFSADVSSFSHGIYYFFLTSQSPSGSHRSKLDKFCITRSP